MAIQGSQNTKWYITCGILAVIIIVMGAVMGWKIKTMNDDARNNAAQISSLQGQVTSLQSDLTSTKTQLTQTQNDKTGLTADLAEATAQIEVMTKAASSAQATISAQEKSITTMRYPRHFTSVNELTDWLQKDDTNIKYKGLPNSQISFILQIRAAREGYLLPVRLPIGGSLDYISNMAVIGDSVYSVRGYDDFVEKWMTINPAMPTYPITIGSD
jgi:hypothetical protein